MDTDVSNSLVLSFKFSINGEVSEKLTYSGEDYVKYETMINDIIVLINQISVSEFIDSGSIDISNKKIVIQLFKKKKKVFSNVHQQFLCKHDLVEVIHELKLLHFHVC